MGGSSQLTSDDGVLRERVRQAIKAGKLPSRRPDGMWGGPGAGAECTVCNAPVKEDEVEFEVEFRNGNGSGLDRYRVHRRCLAVWESERHNLELSGGIDGNER
jgi:hypothetical protein